MVARKSPRAPLTLAYFRERSTVDPSTGCWLWTGAISRGGYGAMRTEGRTQRPHRVAYQLAHGVEVPSSTDICHRCDVRACCNPAHLFAGTRADNMADCAAKGRIRVPVLAGEACPNSKLSAAQVLAVRASEKSNRALARELGVDKGTIACIRQGKTWRDL